jgi:hypothetical protein
MADTGKTVTGGCSSHMLAVSPGTTAVGLESVQNRSCFHEKRVNLRLTLTLRLLHSKQPRRDL